MLSSCIHHGLAQSKNDPVSFLSASESHQKQHNCSAITEPRHIKPCMIGYRLSCRAARAGCTCTCCQRCHSSSTAPSMACAPGGTSAMPRRTSLTLLLSATRPMTHTTSEGGTPIRIRPPLPGAPAPAVLLSEALLAPAAPACVLLLLPAPGCPARSWCQFRTWDAHSAVLQALLASASSRMRAR